MKITIKTRKADILKAYREKHGWLPCADFNKRVLLALYYAPVLTPKV